MKRLIGGKCLFPSLAFALILGGCGGGDGDAADGATGGVGCDVSEPQVSYIPLWVPVTQAGQVQQLATSKPVRCPTESPPVGPPPPAKAAGAPLPPPTAMGLGSPVATALDSEGNLWIADVQMDRLLKFSQGQFVQIAVNPQPDLIIAPATAVTPAAQLLDPSGLAFDEQGNLWVSNFGQNSLVGYTPEQLTSSPRPVFGNVEKPITPAFLVQGKVAADNITLSEPNGLAFSANGSLWVANRANDTLVAYSPGQLAAATLSMSVSSTNQPTPVSTITDAGRSGDLDSPIGLAFQADGDLWVSNRGTLNNLVEFDQAKLVNGGDMAAKATLTLPAPAPTALAFDYQGDLWVLKTRGNAADIGVVTELQEDTLESGTAVVRSQVSGFGNTDVATSISFDSPPANLPLAH